MSTAALDQFRSQMAEASAHRAQAHRDGPLALDRLLQVALGHGGQGKVVANFLLSCYNGSRFKFDLTDFRLLDLEVFQDCLTVLRMDYSPALEVHCYFERGGEILEKLAKDWGIKDHCKRGRQ